MLSFFCKISLNIYQPVMCDISIAMTLTTVFISYIKAKEFSIATLNK